MKLEKVAAEVAPAATSCTHLGTGGFASTFRIQTVDGDDYALKIVDAAQAGAERTDRELSALERVAHPNVVGYQGTGTQVFEGVTYRWLKMDFVAGDTLGNVIKGGQKFNLIEAVDLVRQAVEGAAALWHAQTSHRDLTPNNLMITPAGDLVIVDLGMARALDDKTITTLPTPGTPGWMSPEQVGANQTHGDWRSDQFVLGLNAYWLLTGSLPFTYRTPYEAWMAPDRQTPRNPRDLNPAIPTALADLVMKMLAKAPHRRFLKAAKLIDDIERIAAALSIPEHAPQTTPQFLLAIGDKKSFASAPGFLKSLRPDGIVIEPRSKDRVSEFMALTDAGATERIIDPCTYLSRSPINHRPAYIQRQDYGKGPNLTGFASPIDREAYCALALDMQLEAAPSIVLAPYFFAANGESSWITESLLCASTTVDLLERRAPDREGVLERVWTTVAVAQAWLTQDDARDQLLTMLTSQPIDTLHLLVRTNQPPFAPLGDSGVLNGLTDVLSVMREFEVPVVLGRRASEGLLGLALGATGWTTGVSGVQMNMSSHPESPQRGGPPQDRIYVPQLLTYVTTSTYVQFVSAEPDLVDLDTAAARTLLSATPTLDSLSTEQRVLLLQHNITAMRNQVSELAGQDTAGRISHMRDLVLTAQSTFGSLPAPAGPGESAAYLSAWSTALG
ncbi:serine/threonine-protein kinase [Dietzia lutea]|uniref:non-specific serine/threonine protein kinase n=1 Tax=Dietzia lutea TaxID=546160 RepID=A0A2S1R8C4_9ACTN|nr:serine/threonine-protein kinase [Dietzia lutea]AWH92522.1 hypothetical protein A6035_10500 [Dietzia lutea]